MRWQEKNRKRKTQTKKYINVTEFRKSFFRFLKEFGYYKFYLSGINKYLYSNRYGYDINHNVVVKIEKKVTIDEFFCREIIRPTNSSLFYPFYFVGESCSELINLWRIWAKENLLVDFKTIIVKEKK